jgi:ATP-dependent DNA helicase PIF1
MSGMDYTQEITDDMLSTEQVAGGVEREPPCELICGCAGTGKTYGVVKSVREDPTWGILSSTTGISAVNLGAITVHSLLRYSTTQVLRDQFLTGRLVRVVHALAKKVRRLVVDEGSMADGEQVDLWYRAITEANRYADVDEPLGITMVADFAQLSPVKAKWAFEAACWDKFAANTTRLRKVWRQDAGQFLDALNLVRRGEGAAGAELLASAGARFETALDTEFDGTTILPRNDMVGRFNAMALDRVPEEKFRVSSRRWGKQQPEWGQNVRTKEWGVPPEVELKCGAYVMLLSNAPDFSYVNGDCGWIEEYHSGGAVDNEHIVIKLVRTGECIELPRLVRGVEYSDRPDSWSGRFIPKAEDDGGWHPWQHYRGRVRRYVLGQIQYFPLRLAYATSVHKSQSLTLDRVQVDIRNAFFGQPAMCYVAMSRCRSLSGLRIVGQPEVLAKRCCYDPRIKEWL